MMGAIGIVCIAILVSAFQMDIHIDATFANNLTFLALVVYMIEPLIIGLFTLQLTDQLGGIAFGPATVGAVIALYGFYSYALPMMGIQPMEFLGNFVFFPIPEAAYVIASILLFRRATPRLTMDTLRR